MTTQFFILTTYCRYFSRVSALVGWSTEEIVPVCSLVCEADLTGQGLPLITDPSLTPACNRFSSTLPQWIAGTAAQVSAVGEIGPNQQTELVTLNSPTLFVFAVNENTATEVLLHTGSEIQVLLRKPMPKSNTKSNYICDWWIPMLSISIRLGEEVFNHSVHVVRNSSVIGLGCDFLQTP